MIKIQRNFPFFYSWIFFSWKNHERKTRVVLDEIFEYVTWHKYEGNEAFILFSPQSPTSSIIPFCGKYQNQYHTIQIIWIQQFSDISTKHTEHDETCLRGKYPNLLHSRKPLLQTVQFPATLGLFIDPISECRSAICYRTTELQLSTDHRWIIAFTTYDSFRLKSPTFVLNTYTVTNSLPL